jgi:hypothetical protein
MESALTPRTLSDTVACTLGEQDLKTQGERWHALCTLAGRERVETDDGIRLGFANQPGVADELRALAALENECCAWASWVVTSEDDAIWLDARSTGAGVTTLHRMLVDAATVPDDRD